MRLPCNLLKRHQWAQRGQETSPSIARFYVCYTTPSTFSMEGVWWECQSPERTGGHHQTRGRGSHVPSTNRISTGVDLRIVIPWNALFAHRLPQFRKSFVRQEIANMRAKYVQTTSCRTFVGQRHRTSVVTVQFCLHNGNVSSAHQLTQGDKMTLQPFYSFLLSFSSWLVVGTSAVCLLLMVSGNLFSLCIWSICACVFSSLVFFFFLRLLSLAACGTLADVEAETLWICAVFSTLVRCSTLS